MVHYLSKQRSQIKSLNLHTKELEKEKQNSVLVGEKNTDQDINK